MIPRYPSSKPDQFLVWFHESATVDKTKREVQKRLADPIRFVAQALVEAGHQGHIRSRSEVS